MTTPGIDPDPPRILTPSRTTMVTTSSSKPIPMEGRVDPSRDVRQIAATPMVADTMVAVLVCGCDEEEVAVVAVVVVAVVDGVGLGKYVGRVNS